MRTLEEQADDAGICVVMCLAVALGAVCCWLWFRPWAVVAVSIAFALLFFVRMVRLSARAERAGN